MWCLQSKPFKNTEGKREKRATSLFPRVFSTRLKNLPAIFIKVKLSSANQTLSFWKSLNLFFGKRLIIAEITDFEVEINPKDVKRNKNKCSL